MRRRICAAGLLAAGMLFTGCGIGPTGVLDGGIAPTGVAPGATLYFLDARGHLRPSRAADNRLGDVAGAVDLLLRLGDQSSEGLYSDLPQISSLGPRVTVADTVITVVLPLARREVGPHGTDQVVCTALGVRRQRGDTRNTEVVLTFTDGTRTEPRTCPAF